MARKKKKVAAEVPKPPPGWWVVALLAATFLLYVPSLSNQFVYDADIQLGADDWVHTPSHLIDVLSLRVLGQDVLDGTRPTHLLVFLLESLVWGRNPFGYHLTSVILHCLNVTLVFLVLTELLKPSRLLIPFLSALLFAVHPVNVEAVAEVSYREDLLATFFLLAGLLLAQRFNRSVKPAIWWWAAGSVAAFLLAAGAKETGYIAPLLLFLYWLLYRRTENGGRWTIFLGGAALAVWALAAARFYFQPDDSIIFRHEPSYLGGSFSATLTLQPRLWAFLIAKIFWPVGFSADYTPQDIGFTLAWAIPVLVIFAGAQIFLGFRHRLAWLGIAIFWLGLAPVSNFIPIFKPVADRFLYLPMVGMAILLAVALSLIPRRGFSPVAAIIVLGLGVLTVLSWQREPVFRNNLSLWQDTLARSPWSGPAVSGLGDAHFDAEDYQQAYRYFSAAGQQNPQSAGARAGQARSLERLGNPAAAEEALAQAIALNASYAQPEKLPKTLVETPQSAALLSVIRQRMLAKTPPAP